MDDSLQQANRRPRKVIPEPRLRQFRPGRPVTHTPIVRLHQELAPIIRVPVSVTGVFGLRHHPSTQRTAASQLDRITMRIMANGQTFHRDDSRVVWE